MRQYELPAFGLDNLKITEASRPEPGDHDVLVRFGAASLNYRDYQIITGEFAPTQRLPIVPCSDGAGEVMAAGARVSRFKVGDKVAPLFFPNWLSGPALGNERSISSGLEAPGVLREFGVYDENQVAKVAPHLSAAEAACFPCAGLTAWTSLVDYSGIGPGDWVLTQGTGGVSLFALQLGKALGASVIVTSSSNSKLAEARKLGADATINYIENKNWGEQAREIADGIGVKTVIEVGGTGTLPQSIAAIRRDGHINIIGYLAGADIGLSVYDLIMKNANLHGISVGNRDGFDAMMDCVADSGLKPVIGRAYGFESVTEAVRELAAGQQIGKHVINFIN